MKETIQKEYLRWKTLADDQDVAAELQSMDGNEEQIEDAFYRNLAFGTGGLRGVIGAGTNRMNIYTVAKASQGLADYVNKQFAPNKRSIAISYDSRIKSDVFARVAAGVFAANGIQSYIYKELMPTPCLSYAVRALHCAAGIMVTASHNPSKYNGYKVYGADGCQITTKAADAILAEIEKLDLFDDVKRVSFKEALNVNKVSYISDRVYDDFIEEVKKQSLLSDDLAINKDVSIVYTPLNGTGLKPVLRALKESGYTNITVVKEQEQPDGYFTTCPYPNPEIKEAMELGIAYAKKCNADLLLATDPDCDRVGIAVKNKQGEHVLVTGNEVGMLLLDYICSRRIAMETMPEDPVAVKTIVTIDMAERIAEHYGVKVINVLTGFKFIGEQIKLFEQNHTYEYEFGFEESYGCLVGTHARDKDAIVAVMALCEAAAFYKSKGITLWDQMINIFEKYGYYKEGQKAITMKGAEGAAQIAQMMDNLRNNPPKKFGDWDVIEFRDYKTQECTDIKTGAKSETGLPVSNVLYFDLTDNAWCCARPSGTEPKIKFYMGIKGTNLEDAQDKLEKLTKAVMEVIGQ